MTFGSHYQMAFLVQLQLTVFVAAMDCSRGGGERVLFDRIPWPEQSRAIFTFLSGRGFH